MDAASVKKFKNMVERMKAEDLEDYEIYGCLAKYVSDNLEQTAAAYASVVSYLDKHGISLQEIADYVQSDANDAAAAKFALMIDYFEAKGVKADTLFECLENYVGAGGVTIYTAFGNLMDVDYFNYATVSGYLSSRGIIAESVKNFLDHVVQKEPDLVASLRPVADPDFNVQVVGAGLADTLVDIQDLRSTAETRYGDSAATHSDQFLDSPVTPKHTSSSLSHASVSSKQMFSPYETTASGVSQDGEATGPNSPMLRALASLKSSSSIAEAIMDLHHEKLIGWTKEQAEIVKQDKEALEQLLQTTLKAQPGELTELQSRQQELLEKAEKLEQQNAMLQEQLGMFEDVHGRLAKELQHALASAQRGKTKELVALKGSLEQVVQLGGGLQLAALYHVSSDDVERLRGKMEVLADKLCVQGTGERLFAQPKKEHNFASLEEILPAIDEFDREVERLREESSGTMKQLVVKKVELAETQEEVTKTKRALFRAVNKQMQLGYKIDEMRQMYLSVVSRQSQKSSPRSFSRIRSIN